MATASHRDKTVRGRTNPLVAWGLLAGGVIFFVGGAMHPEEDPPDVTVKEHLRVMYEDGNWWASHTLQFVGLALIAAALVLLVRSGALAHIRRAHTAAIVGATTVAAGAAETFLHLISATDADRIAAGSSTPLTNTLIPVETIVLPIMVAGVAWLAIIGARTGTIGNRAAAVVAVVGGIPFALAGATFAFTDALDALFPFGGYVGVWAVVTGVGLLRHTRTTEPRPIPAAAR
ncbi:MAG: hypothetical protein ACRD0G_12555 [Acidimicrobiales bacterium]